MYPCDNTKSQSVNLLTLQWKFFEATITKWDREKKSDTSSSSSSSISVHISHLLDGTCDNVNIIMSKREIKKNLVTKKKKLHLMKMRHIHTHTLFTHPRANQLCRIFRLHFSSASKRKQKQSQYYVIITIITMNRISYSHQSYCIW